MGNLIPRLSALVIGLGLAAVIIELVLRTVPGLIPIPVFYTLPGGGRYLQPLVFDQPIETGFRFEPLQDRSINYNPDDPSLLGEQAKDIALKDEPLRLRLRFRTDGDGFLNSARHEGPYDTVITGDSFLGLSSEEHWVDWLTFYTNGRKARNLGIPGWGPQAEAAALRLYGTTGQPEQMVLAYFEGNDLWDAVDYEKHRASGKSWRTYDLEGTGIWDRMVLPALTDWGIRQLVRRWEAFEDRTDAVYRYPFDVELGGRPLALVFSDQYISRLTASRADIEASTNFALTTEALRAARDVAEANGARFTLVYIPSEEHVYLPLIWNDPALPGLVASLPTFALGPDGTLGPTATPVSVEALRAHADAQRDALADFAAREGMTMVDLTPRFQIAATTGETLYNYADTHWNAAGHKLAAQVLGEHLGEP